MAVVPIIIIPVRMTVTMPVAMTAMPVTAVAMSVAVTMSVSVTTMSMATMALAGDRSGREHHSGSKGDRETKSSNHFISS